MPDYETHACKDAGRIDEAVAWSLVNAARHAAFDGIELARSVRSQRDDIAIEISATGGWSAWHPVTPKAAKLLDIYLPYVASGKACTVLAQLGQSLDGYIATQTGHSKYVTGAAGLDHLHRLRAISDVVVVGVGTVIADDPRLTVRRAVGSNPVRAVIDPGGRTPRDQRIFNDHAAPTIVLTTEASAAAHEWPADIDIVSLPDDHGNLSPGAIIGALSSRGHRNILIEGGGTTVSRFLQAGVLDRLHVCVAPLIIGSGRPGFSLAPVAKLGDAHRFVCRHHPLGDDVLFDLKVE